MIEPKKRRVELFYEQNIENMKLAALSYKQAKVNIFCQKTYRKAHTIGQDQFRFSGIELLV